MVYITAQRRKRSETSNIVFGEKLACLLAGVVFKLETISQLKYTVLRISGKIYAPCLQRNFLLLLINPPPSLSLSLVLFMLIMFVLGLNNTRTTFLLLIIASTFVFFQLYSSFTPDLFPSHHRQPSLYLSPSIYIYTVI